MERFGMDLCVVAFYLAWAWAVKAGQEGEAFYRLGRNALFDFQYFESSDASFLEAGCLLESSEMMREYFGLDQSRLIVLVAETKKVWQKRGEPTTAASIAAFLKTSVRWSNAKRCPSEQTVGHLLQISQLFSKAPRARHAVAVAESLWGRDTVFDETSKVGQG